MKFVNQVGKNNVGSKYINIIPEKKTDSIRDKMVDELTEHFCAERYENNFCNYEEAREEAKHLADCLFEVIGISPIDQDKVGAKVVINPKVKIRIDCGMADTIEAKGVDVEYISKDE